MTVTVSAVDPESIQPFDTDWGATAEGITFGQVSIYLSDKSLDALSVVVSMLQQERAEKHAIAERDATRDCEFGIRHYDDFADSEVA